MLGETCELLFNYDRHGRLDFTFVPETSQHEFGIVQAINPHSATVAHSSVLALVHFDKRWAVFFANMFLIRRIVRPVS
ncbi:MAG: hypothetical protein ACI87E_002192 [Mariniblastus sp.]|jgi:hypothetical protein